MNVPNLYLHNVVDANHVSYIDEIWMQNGRNSMVLMKYGTSNVFKANFMGISGIAKIILVIKQAKRRTGIVSFSYDRWMLDGGKGQ